LSLRKKRRKFWHCRPRRHRKDATGKKKREKKDPALKNCGSSTTTDWDERETKKNSRHSYWQKKKRYSVKSQINFRERKGGKKKKPVENRLDSARSVLLSGNGYFTSTRKKELLNGPSNSPVESGRPPRVSRRKKRRKVSVISCARKGRKKKIKER